MLHEAAAKQLLSSAGSPAPCTYILDDGRGTITAVFGDLGAQSAAEWEPCGTRAHAWADGCCKVMINLPWPQELLKHEVGREICREMVLEQIGHGGRCGRHKWVSKSTTLYPDA